MAGYKSQKQYAAHQAILEREQQAYLRSIGMPKKFGAKYKGKCGAEGCGTGIIRPGCELCYFEGKLIHYGCADRIISKRMREASCATCKGLHIYKDENGKYQECDC